MGDCAPDERTGARKRPGSISLIRREIHGVQGPYPELRGTSATPVDRRVPRGGGVLDRNRAGDGVSASRVHRQAPDRRLAPQQRGGEARHAELACKVRQEVRLYPAAPGSLRAPEEARESTRGG